MPGAEEAADRATSFTKRHGCSAVLEGQGRFSPLKNTRPTTAWFRLSLLIRRSACGHFQAQ